MLAEWLFTIPVIYNELQKMIKIINQELLKCVPDSSAESSDKDDTILRPVVCVSVTCIDGTQVSPCYVEKLYEMYRHNPPVKDLTVKREHTHPVFKNASLGERKEFVWQRTTLAMKYLSSRMDNLTNHRWWTPFPMHLLSAIEEGFKRDPFNNKLEIPYSKNGGKYVLNFETGEVYSNHDQALYRIRCVISDFDDMFTCDLLTGTSYKPFSKSFDAAGMLFYSAHPVTGEPVFLLGHMTYGSLSWCDFGGLKKFR